MSEGKGGTWDEYLAMRENARARKEWMQNLVGDVDPMAYPTMYSNGRHAPSEDQKAKMKAGRLRAKLWREEIKSNNPTLYKLMQQKDIVEQLRAARNKRAREAYQRKIEADPEKSMYNLKRRAVAGKYFAKRNRARLINYLEDLTPDQRAKFYIDLHKSKKFIRGLQGAHLGGHGNSIVDYPEFNMQNYDPFTGKPVGKVTKMRWNKRASKKTSASQKDFDQYGDMIAAGIWGDSGGRREEAKFSKSVMENSDNFGPSPFANV